MSDYDRIASAIDFIAMHLPAQPQLHEIAQHVGLSPFHFQRVFARWAGTTPKRLLQVLTLERSKDLLHGSPSLLALSDELGLSSTSRLHEHFVRLEAATPGEYRSGGDGVRIRYGAHATPFGEIFAASTERGICKIAFLDPAQQSTRELSEPLAQLRAAWPHAALIHDAEATRYVADAIGEIHPSERPLSLHVSGTNFQIAVWRALLRIPPGRAVSYAALARAVGRPRASRAVGNAVGANPIAFLIPCHRVVLSSGALGHYRWGETRKRAMQVRERLQDGGDDFPLTQQDSPPGPRAPRR